MKAVQQLHQKALQCDKWARAESTMFRHAFIGRSIAYKESAEIVQSVADVLVDPQHNTKNEKK